MLLWTELPSSHVAIPQEAVKYTAVERGSSHLSSCIATHHHTQSHTTITQPHALIIIHHPSPPTLQLLESSNQTYLITQITHSPL